MVFAGDGVCLLLDFGGGVFDVEKFEDGDGLGWVDFEEFAAGVDAVGAEGEVEGGFDLFGVGDATGEFDLEGEGNSGGVELADPRFDAIGLGAADFDEAGHGGIG